MSQPPSSSPFHTPQQQQPTPISSTPKKTPPLPWTHLETVNLIEAYQEKWYSLKRGQLKASQWEEVASSVAARCGFKELSKSSTQCRHKMEKLRKRYRGEKKRGTPTVWNYFDMMDMMERGPLPLNSRPAPPPPRPTTAYLNHCNPPIDNSSEEDDEEEEDESNNNKSTSLNHLLLRGGGGGGGGGGGRPPIEFRIFDALPLPTKYGGERGGGEGPRGSRSPMFRKRKREFKIDEVEEEEEEEEEEEDEDGGGGRLLSELASVVRSFSEGFVRVENMKMEMMMEQERHRVEMEKKRTEMIQESQRCIVDAIVKTFDAYKKPKKTQ